jgi:hypothetical protein
MSNFPDDLGGNIAIGGAKSGVPLTSDAQTAYNTGNQGQGELSQNTLDEPVMETIVLFPMYLNLRNVI